MAPDQPVLFPPEQRGRRPLLIALYSPASRSGKSTIARLLGPSFGRVSFAEPIVWMAETVLSNGTGAFEADWMSPERKDAKVLHGKSPRDLMVAIGTAMRDLISPDIWLDIGLRKAAEIGASGADVVIDDMRQPNEYDALRKAGALLVRVVRPGRAPRAMDGLLDGRQFHATIVNDGGLEDLERAAADLLPRLRHMSTMMEAARATPSW